MIIDPKKISFDEILADIVSKIQSLPDYSRWQDFYSDSTGQVFIELLSGFSAYLSFLTIVNRREAFKDYAENRSSIIAGSESLGYSTFRGKNIHLILTVIPNSSITINKFDVIGSYNEFDVVSANDYILSSGVQSDIEIIIGELKEEENIVITSSPNVFRFISPKVSEDIQLSLNDTVLDISNTMTGILDHKYSCISNALGSLDVFYDNSGGIIYDVNDIIKLKYIELKDMSINTTNIEWLIDISVNNVDILSSFRDQETKDNMRINSSLFHETELIVRSREDYMNEFRLNIPNVSSVNYVDINASEVKLSYCLNDGSTLTTQEKSDILNIMLTYRPMGLKPPIIYDPEEITAILNVNITLLVNESISVINSDISDILTSYVNILGMNIDSSGGDYDRGGNIDLEKVEHDIETKHYVKIARVEIQDSSRNIDPDSGKEDTYLKWNQYFNFTVNLVID